MGGGGVKNYQILRDVIYPEVRYFSRYTNYKKLFPFLVFEILQLYGMASKTKKNER